MSNYEIVLVDITARELSEDAWYKLGGRGDEIYAKVNGEDIRPLNAPFFWKFDAPDKSEKITREIFTGDEGSEASFCLMEQDKLSAHDALGTIRIKTENGKVELIETAGASYKGKDGECCHIVDFYGLPHCKYEVRFCVKCFERI